MGKLRTGSKIFYLIFGLAVGLALSYDMVLVKSIDMSKPGVTLDKLFAGSFPLILLELIAVIVLMTSFLEQRKQNGIGIADWKPVKTKFLYSLIGLVVGLIFDINFAWGTSNDLSQMGVTLWSLLVIGGIIILLQLIPAIILFIGFTGAMTKLMQKKFHP